MHSDVQKGRQDGRYNAIAIMLRSAFVLSHNATTLWIKVIAFYSNRSRLIEIVIKVIVLS
jgi:hypothetical protein